MNPPQTALPPPLLFDLAELLAPLPGDDPAGPSLRYDRAMSDIRRARECDDPSLPMGEWDRPLKKADWPAVVLLGTRLLAERSKDLQIAAWLTEAWVHLHDLAGLQAGISLMVGLVERHWDGVHPRLDDDGDCEARIAPLVWLNENLPLALRLQISLTEWPERRPPRITLEDWDQSLRPRPEEDPPDRNPPPGDLQPMLPTREELLRGTRGPTLAELRLRRERLLHVSGEWARLRSLVDERLGADGPSLGRVADTLTLIERALNQLIAARPAPPEPVPELPPAAPQAEPLAAEVPTDAVAVFPDASPWSDPMDAITDSLMQGLETHATTTALPTETTRMSVRSRAPIGSRQQAYRLLAEVADYLQQHEPHSPTPYLVRRAVRWGEMPLPELMQEMLREEGDLNRLFRLLDVAPADH